MPRLLEKIFIKTTKDENSNRLKYGVFYGLLGIILNVLLFAGKLVAGIFSGSIAIIADALNNLSDSASSIVTLLGFKIAAQKPDSGHPFGHGRMEYISSFIVAFLIFFMGIELIRGSIEKIINPSDTTFSILILVILLVSILVKLYMAYYNYSVGKRIKSLAMKNAYLDSIFDSLSTTLVLACLLITHYTSVNLDGYCGIFIGVIILIASIKALMSAVNPLLGQSPDPKLAKDIEELVLKHQYILGVHDLVIHDYGPGHKFATIHAEVDARDDILKTHDEIDNIETEILNTLHCLATIHMDPLVIDDPEINRNKQVVKEIVRNIDSRLSFHDFRMVVGPTHINMLFDVVVPYECKYSDEYVKEKLQTAIHEQLSVKNKQLNLIVTVDKELVK